MAGQGGPNVDLFDAYFRRADLDQDGRISGAEAVAFFQGSNLSKQVLAQIWMHADPRGTGYLGRPEFYNALKLVTVAQSKRDLTPDIVKAALYGPASTKIPAPQINLSSIPPPRMNTAVPSPAPAPSPPQMTALAPTNMQNVGFKGHQVPPNAGGGIMNQQQYYPSQGNQVRPPSSMSVGTASRPPQVSDVSNSNNPSNWLGNRPPNRGLSPSSTPPNPLDQLSQVSSFAANAPKPPSDPMFEGDMFSATRSLVANQSSPAPTPTYSVGVSPVPSTTLPVTTGPQSSSMPDPFVSLQKNFPKQSTGPQPWQTQSQPKSNQEPSPGTTAGVGNPTSNWPKMTRAGVQKYAKVFVEVDTDRDGKITGEQARNLFLSWRLPREVLKQVWDLSDQDNDSMLSLREFCVALYLMERYREGQTLPPELPSTVLLDETLSSIAGPPHGGGPAAWVSATPPSGFRPQHGVPGIQHRIPPTGLRPPVQGVRQNDRTVLFNQQQNSSVASAGNFHLNQFNNKETNPLDSQAQNTEDKEQKVQSTILDSREKMEFYRTKMQDLVLYKSRCDNRLNEISERALADKREAELLAKKYEEKYKHVAEIAAKLTIEEASFREVQERKMELNQAIIKMEQGGSADGILQVRADRIQSDMEELLKGLSERCKKHGVDVKSSILVELPLGWQPGIPEISSVWDEEWDKFEDEGFSFDGANGKSSSAATVEKGPLDSYPAEDSFSEAAAAAAASADVSKVDEHDHLETESVAYNFHSEDDGSSSARQTAYESPSKEYIDNHFTDAQSQRGESFDEPNWGTFDNHDEDIDSVWGFSTSNTAKEEEDKYIFGSSGFGASPTRTESPDNKYGGGGVDSFFANSSRFDSFSSRGGFSPPKETSFTRFDSISSSAGGYSFDDSDPFGSTGPFKVSSDNKKGFS